jgi:hypothetical protein
MKKKSRYDTPEQAAEKRKDWANYMRMHYRPTKQCARCLKEFPNTDEHFARGRKLTSTCQACARIKTMRKADRRLLDRCPICLSLTELQLDEHCVPPELACRSCRMMANNMMCRETAERFAWYLIRRWARHAEPRGTPERGSREDRLHAGEP